VTLLKSDLYYRGISVEAKNTTRVILRLDPELLQAKITFFS